MKLFSFLSQKLSSFTFSVIRVIYTFIWYFSFDICLLIPVLDTSSFISDLWYLTFDTWSLIPDLCYLTFDTWLLISDLWYLTFDTWPLIHYLWYLAFDTWPLLPVLWYMSFSCLSIIPISFSKNMIFDICLFRLVL